MSMTQAWPRDALPRGTVLYGYEIDGFLGRGGFGITYRATDRINQMFALKECFPRQFAVREGMTVAAVDDDYNGQMFSKCLESFTKEALALTRFSRLDAAGDGVIKVITSFETNGTAYIVMEFVEGDSLERLINAYPGGLPEADLVPILCQLTSTLSCVHRNGLLHRDIKPANLILRGDGRPVLLDFGAARAVRADGPMPSQIFTETYAPIEQIEGRAQGPFSDLYSLGVTCYQAVAGSRFRRSASSSDRYRAMLRREPDPLVPASVIGEGRYSDSLLRAIDLLLRIPPEERPQTVEHFMPHLEETVALATRAGSAGVGSRVLPETIAATPKPRPGLSDAETVIPLTPAIPVAGYPSHPRPSQDVTVVTPGGMVKPVSQPARSGGGARVAMLGAGVLLLAAGGGGAYWYETRQPPAKPPQTAVAPSDNAQKSELPPEPEKKVAPQPLAPGLASANDAYAQRDYASALQGFQQAAATGDPVAEYQLGYMYQLGQGVQPDPGTAMSWYRRAAAQNYAPAQSQIGYMNQYGVGMRQDYAAAAHWYNLAAAQGFKTAQFELGYLSQHGFGTPKNYYAALHWYQMAAAQGSASAQNQLGYLYQKGLGVNMNYAEALSHYKAAAEQGLPAAQYSLGLFYQDGLGVPRDPALARSWITKAAAGGNAEANAWLAAH
jgi:TPR repeat protein/serine/threonine protein kinase